MARRSNGYGPSVVGDRSDKESARPEHHLTRDSQWQRRDRILDAAVEAASAGGFDLVHMRDVAERADVSMATIYYYFSSKVHLLVRALERELTRFEDYLGHDLCVVSDPFAKLRVVVRRLVASMEGSSRRFSDALTHAYVAATVVASVEAEAIRVLTRDVFARLMSDGVATDLHLHTADLLTDVWTSEILALVQGRRTHAQMRHRLTKVIDLVARGPGLRAYAIETPKTLALPSVAWTPYPAKTLHESGGTAEQI
jgi:TetR/AcrR family transcriptional regulator, cholesterol catabolism regulator